MPHRGRLAPALLVAALVLLAGAAHAQPTGPQHLWEITPLVGVGWGGKLDFEDSASASSGTIELDSGPVIGGQIGARVSEEGMGFIRYQFQRSHADVHWDGPQADQEIDVNIGWLQIGGELELPMGPHFVPFFGLSVGATHIGPRSGAMDPEWFFSGSAFGGAKVPITKFLGLRFDLSLLTTAVQNDSDILCVSSGGLTCAVSADLESMVQGAFTVGAYLAF